MFSHRICEEGLAVVMNEEIYDFTRACLQLVTSHKPGANSVISEPGMLSYVACRLGSQNYRKLN